MSDKFSEGFCGIDDNNSLGSSEQGYNYNGNKLKPVDLGQGANDVAYFEVPPNTIQANTKTITTKTPEGIFTQILPVSPKKKQTKN